MSFDDFNPTLTISIFVTTCTSLRHIRQSIHIPTQTHTYLHVLWCQPPAVWMPPSQPFVSNFHIAQNWWVLVADDRGSIYTKCPSFRWQCHGQSLKIVEWLPEKNMEKGSEQQPTTKMKTWQEKLKKKTTQQLLVVFFYIHTHKHTRSLTHIHIHSQTTSNDWCCGIFIFHLFSFPGEARSLSKCQ